MSKYMQMIKPPRQLGPKVKYTLEKRIVNGVEILVKVYQPEKSVFDQLIK